MNRSIAIRILGTALAILVAAPAAAQTTNDDLLVFPASFFAEAQPATAYDMVLRLPGFAFEAGDAEVQGLAGSGGNVLIDGRRPAAKGDTLDAILKRIPAAAVLRIELIRNGANGVDMQGAPLLANVIRRRESALRGQAEASVARYGDGRTAPSLRASAVVRRARRRSGFIRASTMKRAVVRARASTRTDRCANARCMTSMMVFGAASFRRGTNRRSAGVAFR